MAKQEKYSLEGIHYATGKAIRIDIEGGLISGIQELSDNGILEKGIYLSPGLIDNQINGYSNVDYSGDSLTAEAFIRSARAIWTTGVTTFFPTLITNSDEKLLRNFRILREALDSDELVRGAVPGYHLEGPYISPGEGYRGCHPVEHTRKPSWSEFSSYQEAAGGKIIQVTLAPELEGAIEFMRLCRKNGITIAIGHSNATADDINAAVRNGASLSTHLGNGCANMIHRHNNPIWPQLAEEGLVPTIIADGFHLLPEEIKVFLKVKGPSRLILTSDVMYLSGMAPGLYSFMGSEVRLTPEGMLRNVELNCLAGASFPLRTGVGNIVRFTGCSLAEAINMASSNLSDIYGFTDRGVLEPGRRADIIQFTFSDYKMELLKTFTGGELVYTA